MKIFHHNFFSIFLVQINLKKGFRGKKFFQKNSKKISKNSKFFAFFEIFHNFPFPKMKCKNRYQKFQLLAIKKSYSVVKLSNSLLSGTFSKKTVRNETPYTGVFSSDLNP